MKDPAKAPRTFLRLVFDRFAHLVLTGGVVELAFIEPVSGVILAPKVSSSTIIAAGVAAGGSR